MSKQLSFQQQVAAFIKDRPDRVRDIALNFDVADSTVTRWGNGITSPLPRMQTVIIAHISERLTQEMEKG
jgi:hypothetical protein